MSPHPLPASPAEPTPPSGRPEGRARGGGPAALALFALLAIVHTWPLASAPGVWSRNDTGDALLNEWAIAWVAHQAVTDPAHLFDANIFYPERKTLALSEHLLPQAAMVAPLLWAGASPVLAHNIALLLGLVLTGWAMWHMVRTWTGNWTAGLIAGSLAAFNAHTLARLAHVQAQHLEFLPLALLALDRVLTAPRLRHALSLAGWFVLQALSSGYFLLFGAVSMVSAWVVRWPEWSGRRARQVTRWLVVSAITALVLLLPFMLPYRFVRQEFGFVRQMREIASYSAVPTDYLATGARVHAAWAAGFFRGDGLFPGVVALALAAAAIAAGVAFRDRRARMLLAIALATFCLSFGVNLPGYSWLYRFVPLFDAIRAPVRFGQFTLLALAGLAGFGAAWWLARLSTSRSRAIVGAMLAVLVNAEALRAPIFFVEHRGEPKILARLPDRPDVVVAYFPFYYEAGSIGGNARYMLWSTLNWRPMLNGYSGLMPPSFYQHAEGVRTFPLTDSLDYLRSAGVTHVVVDTERLSRPRVDLLPQAAALHLWAADGCIRIYELAGEARR